MTLPPLGPRGEGWLVGQLVLLAAVAVSPANGWTQPAGTIGLLGGAASIVVGLAVAGRGVLDLGSNLSPFPRPKGNAVLVERGVYRYLRHPIYAGLVLLSIGWSVARGSLVGLGVAVVLAVFFDLKARREEALLAETFPGYEGYAARTRRFIPGLY